jgi:hypothetical protein
VIAEGKPEDILYDEKLLQSAGLEMPMVAKLFTDLGLESKGVKRPLSLEQLTPLIKK